MSTSQKVLRQDVTTLVIQDGVVNADAVSLQYDPADPYAVRMAVTAAEATVEWVFARDLLSAGADAAAGEGDIWITSDAGAVIIEVRGDGSTFQLQCARREVEQFLSQSLELVPRGAESMDVDMDELLAGLLR